MLRTVIPGTAGGRQVTCRPLADLGGRRLGPALCRRTGQRPDARDDLTTAMTLFREMDMGFSLLRHAHRVTRRATELLERQGYRVVLEPAA